jgi:hypothetical protein
MDYKCEVDKKKLFFYKRGIQEKSIQVSARVFFYEYVYMYIYVVCIFSSSNTFFCRYEDGYKDDDADKEAAAAAGVAATTNKEDNEGL